MYGPEKHETKIIREKFYHNLRIEVKGRNIRNDNIIIVSDLNGKLGEKIIPRDIHTI